MKKSKIFIRESEKISFDRKHRDTINFNISKYDKALDKGKEHYKNLDLAKDKASQIKDHTIQNLAHYLRLFEKNFKANGGEVIWAKEGNEASQKIVNVLKDNNINVVVKSKSMISEEIQLNEHLENNGIESLETDLGEFIVQVAHEKPYHIVTPAMHKSKEDVAGLFHKLYKTPLDATPEELTNYVRLFLREKYIRAGAGITGANFLIADTGAIALTENEGNGLMSTSFPRVHIIIAGIEKILPKLEQLDLFWPLLAHHGTGQNVTVYNTIFKGPKKKNERDGPEKVVVVLLDNGRTHLYKQEKKRKALKCIRCGACLNACPVYKNIGGYTYNTVYSGPIGAVITPYMKNVPEYKHLSFASSLCGKCTEVCPVKIDLHKLLLENRKDAVVRGYTLPAERIAMKTYEKISKNRIMFDFGPHYLRNIIAQKFLKRAWGNRRKLPGIKKSFAKEYLERQKK